MIPYGVTALKNPTTLQGIVAHRSVPGALYKRRGKNRGSRKKERKWVRMGCEEWDGLGQRPLPE